MSIPDFFATWSAVQVGEAIEAAVRSALVGTIVPAGRALRGDRPDRRDPAVRRALTPRGLKRDRVRRRAAEQFLAKNLHLTRERTGVLIFVSLGEHMAELIADEGIAQHVDKKVWDRAMAALTAGLKRGEPAAGFEAAIGLCADVLAERFPPTDGDNPNELPDKVVMLPKA